MSASNDIFPKRQHPNYVQTQWSEGWGYAVIRFGEAARRLTDQREAMRANVDQIGLAVFFLQRHRVELVMKQALLDLGEDAPAVLRLGHNLDAIWRRLGEVVTTIDAKHWTHRDDRFRDFVQAIHGADAGSFSYRYPVDKRGVAVQREAFIDLDELQHHAEDFEGGVGGYTDWVGEWQQDVREHGAEMEAEYAAEMDADYGDEY